MSETAGGAGEDLFSGGEAGPAFDPNMTPRAPSPNPHDPAPTDAATPDDRLRRHQFREELLRAVVTAVAPSTLDPAIWLKWLSGDADLRSMKMPTAHRGTQSLSREMDRSSNKVRTARAARDRAARTLADAERALERAQEDDSSMIYSSLSAHLAKIMEPIFAMGPAWTLIRALGPHVDSEEMADHLLFATSPENANKIELRVREERVTLSRRIHASLDFWAGDKDFEIDLREAVAAVVNKYEQEKVKAASEGRRARSREDAIISVRSEAMTSSREVVGL